MTAGKLTALPVGEWGPDTGILTGSAEVKGCIPLSGRYAPLADLAPIRADAKLNDACIGGFSCYGSTGQSAAFLGDSGRLYRIINKSPTDVSKTGGYTASADWCWKFEQFGNNVIAVARGAPTQRYIIGSDSQFSDLANAPQGDTVFRIRQQLFVCQNQTVNVSGFNNITVWDPLTAGAQAFSGTLRQDAGIIVAGYGGEQGAIFQERGIVRITYTGGSVPYIFDEIEGARGLCSPNAYAVWGKGCFCVAEDGFYYFDGATSTPIGENKVDRYFSQLLNYPYRGKVWSAIDAKRKCWMVGFPSGASQVCNEVLIYSWADQKWTHDYFNSQYGFELARTGVSADDSAEIIRLFGTQVENDPAFANVSVDSAIWRESRKEWAVVDGSRTVMQFTGANRAATLNTGVIEPIPGKNVFVSELYPVTDAETGVSATLEARARRLGQSNIIVSNATMNTNGVIPVRGQGRYLSATITIAAGTTWTEVDGLQSDGVPAGGR